MTTILTEGAPVKQVPGRKTDIADAQWLAILARNGLLRGGFVPPVQFRELRRVARQMQKLTGQLSAEKNRLHKALANAGVRLAMVVSDLQGKSAKAMIKGLLAGETPAQVVRYADKRLKATEDELLEALDGDLSASHRFVVGEILTHCEALEARIGRFRQPLLQGLAPYRTLLPSLETLPGVDETAAALLRVEIGGDRGGVWDAHQAGFMGRALSGQQRIGGQKEIRQGAQRQPLCAPDSL